MRAVRVSMFSLCIPTHGTVVCITSCFSSDHTGNYTRKIYPVNSNCFFFFFLPSFGRACLYWQRNSCLNKSSAHLQSLFFAWHCRTPLRTPRSQSEGKRCHVHAWADAGSPRPSEDKKRLRLWNFCLH